MKPYNLEVSWSADDYAVASKALKACKKIDADPLAIAKMIPAIWQLLQDALPIIEDEADRRDAAQARDEYDETYYSEMRELVDRLGSIIYLKKVSK